MIEKVCHDDQNQFSSLWAKEKLRETEIFSNTQKVINQLERYYHDVFSQLVYSDILPDIKDINKSARIIGDILKERNL